MPKTLTASFLTDAAKFAVFYLFQKHHKAKSAYPIKGLPTPAYITTGEPMCCSCMATLIFLGFWHHPSFFVLYATSHAPCGSAVGSTQCPCRIDADCCLQSDVIPESTGPTQNIIINQAASRMPTRGSPPTTRGTTTPRPAQTLTRTKPRHPATAAAASSQSG